MRFVKRFKTFLSIEIQVDGFVEFIFLVCLDGLGYRLVDLLFGALQQNDFFASENIFCLNNLWRRRAPIFGGGNRGWNRLLGKGSNGGKQKE
ncbi:hypothetical protein SDC9_136087 [bioreactor metagenome]|uniref:Uncharacterized protein n=1 Tax=bioreactor metagenome TaxID=1076179 RepID=A0A645DI53_9ZZZZ